MTVSLRGTTAPIRDVSNLGYAAVAVYSLLFESAYKEHEFHRPAHGAPYVTAGTTHWSHKAISQTLHMGKATLIKAIDRLLDNGYVTVIGYSPSTTGSVHRVYRVLHPDHVKDQQHALEVIGMPASTRQKARDQMARETYVEYRDEECEERAKTDDELKFYIDENHRQTRLVATRAVEECLAS